MSVEGHGRRISAVPGESKLRSPRLLRVRPIIIAILYALGGGLWLATTDLLVGWLFPDPQGYMIAQLAKGPLYIFTTAAIIYWLARRAAGTLEKEEVEQRLLVTEHMLDTLLDSMNEAVLFVEPAGRKIVTCNVAAERLFGYDRSELIGQGTELLHIDREHHDRFAEMGEPALQKEGVFRCEYQMRRKDGSNGFTVKNRLVRPSTEVATGFTQWRSCTKSCISRRRWIR